MGIFEKYLSIWVGVCIVIGVSLGAAAPELIQLVSRFEYSKINLLIAALIWVMIYPMMIGVDFTSMKDVGRKPKGLIITLVTNWLIKPFTMALLGMFFFRYIFSDFISPEEANEYIAGMILLGVAPCTAMVFVWSHLTKGDPNYTLLQVSINDLIMIFAFAPLSGMLLGMSDIKVAWSTLFLSVVLYVVIPLVAGYLTRRQIKDSKRLDIFTAKLKPLSALGLLSTLVLLFAFQAETILEQPFVVLLIAIPLLIQSYGVFAFAYWWAYKWRLSHDIAAPAAMISTSNFFELAVAVAISIYGMNSGASLATVVGVLIEVPVMLSLVFFANKSRAHFDERRLNV